MIVFSLGTVVGAEPLNDAAKEGNLDEVKRLIEEGANIEVRDSSRATPLYNALDQGNKDVVEFLILKGANVNVNCTEGYTPLHRATRLFGGDKELVNLLIANGANVNAVDDFGYTPLHMVLKIQWNSLLKKAPKNNLDGILIFKSSKLLISPTKCNYQKAEILAISVWYHNLEGLIRVYGFALFIFIKPHFPGLRFDTKTEAAINCRYPFRICNFFIEPDIW
jgi:hypothetical protein